MAGILYRDPVRAISGGTIYPGARLSVFESDGETLAAIYADVALDIRLSNPLTADSAGRLPPIYAALGVELVARLVDAGGETVFEEAITPDLMPLAVYGTDPRDDRGELMPGATRTFYAEDTTELAIVWADDSLSEEQANPVQADEFGEFPAVYLDSDRRYRAVLHEAPGNPEVRPDVGYYAGKSYIGGRLIYDVPVRLLAGEEPDAVDLRFIAAGLGDFSGVRTWEPPVGTILEDSGFLSERFDTYDHIVASFLVEFRARTGPYSQDAFESITLIEMGLTLYTAEAEFGQDAPNTVWQWFVDLPGGYDPGNIYSLRFT